MRSLVPKVAVMATCLWFGVAGGAQAQNLFNQPSGQPPASNWPPRFDQAPTQPAQPSQELFRAFAPQVIEGRWMVEGTKAVLLFQRSQIRSSSMGESWYATLLVDTLKHYKQGDVLLANLQFDRAATLLQRSANPIAIVFSAKIMDAPETPGDKFYRDCKVVLAGPATLYVVMAGISQTVLMHKLDTQTQ